MFDMNKVHYITLHLILQDKYHVNRYLTDFYEQLTLNVTQKRRHNFNIGFLQEYLHANQSCPYTESLAYCSYSIALKI